jgi:hypothetical protein
MDDIELRLVETTSKISTALEDISDLPDAIGKTNTSLAARLVDLTMMIETCSRRVESLASDWHYTDR